MHSGATESSRYIAFVEEFPGANSPRTNLREAVALVVEANRVVAREEAGGRAAIRETITVDG